MVLFGRSWWTVALLASVAAGAHAQESGLQIEPAPTALRCLQRLDPGRATLDSIAAIQEFQFIPRVANPTVFWGPVRDDSEAQLLGIVKDLPNQKVRFDFATMNCPFSVKFAPYRPYAANSVGQIGETNSNRREFVEWLRNVTLDVPPNDMRTVIGEVVTIAVPCTVLDLL